MPRRTGDNTTVSDCCTQPQTTSMGRPDYLSLPQSVFCCMAELAFEIATITLADGGVRSGSWWTLEVEERQAYADKCKAYIIGHDEPVSDIEKIMRTVVVCLTSR